MADPIEIVATRSGGVLLGYRCPKDPAGRLIPPGALTDPCGRDVAVYADSEKHDEDHGRVWDQWGGLSERDKGRIRRRHPRLAAVLEDITERVAADLGETLRSAYSGSSDGEANRG